MGCCMAKCIRLELPIPPSVNKFVARYGNSSPDVRTWRRQCDVTIMSMGKHPGKTHGEFEAYIQWDEGYRRILPGGKKNQHGRDIDNMIKPLLDYLQDIEVIENDGYCSVVIAEWAELPLGTCTVTITEIVEPE